MKQWVCCKSILFRKHEGIILVMAITLSKLFCLLFGYSMSVPLPEAVQILVKNKFEIQMKRSVMHAECVHDFLSRLEQ